MFACHADGVRNLVFMLLCKYVCAKIIPVKHSMNPPIQKPITVNCQLRRCRKRNGKWSRAGPRTSNADVSRAPYTLFDSSAPSRMPDAELCEIPVRNLMQLDRKLDRHDTALPVWTVLQFKRAAVRLRNLTREDKSDAAARRLGCVERHESIAGIHQSGSIILDRDDHILGGRFPGEQDLLFGIRTLRS